MKNMKKIISLMLCAATVISLCAVFSSCGLLDGGLFGGKEAKGTDGAKILLARERLSESHAGQKSSIWAQVGSFVSLRSENSALTQLISSNSASPSFVGYTQSGGKGRWTDFGVTSEFKDSYTQFIDPIDQAAAELAETIVYLKENVGVTEKWVGDHLLIVGETSETVVYLNEQDRIDVSTRYTTEDAKCVYEMYTFMDYGNGETGRILNVCVPEEHYEYMFMHSNGFNDFFIADKSHGYWTMNRFSGSGESLIFDMAFVKDGIGYGGILFTHEDGSTSVSNLNVFLPNQERDLFGIDEMLSYNGNGEPVKTFEIDLYLSAVTSGISAISTTDTQGVYSEVYGGSGTVYLMFEGNGSTTVELSNGKSFAPNSALTQNITYIETVIRYSPEYHADCYTGHLRFSVTANDAAAALSMLEKHLNESGISLCTDTSMVAEAYSHASLMAEDYGTYTEWNGYQLDSPSAITAATAVLVDNFDGAYSLYESVRNNEKASKSTKISAKETLSAFDFVSAESVTYSNGVISVDHLALSIDDTNLLEEGMSYAIRLGLVRRDTDGKLIAMTMVPLAANSIISESFGGGNSFSLKVSNAFTLPAACSEGEYVVVAYIATADEGIRVTEMSPLAVYSAEEGKLDSEVMDVTVQRSGDELRVSYGIKLAEWTECDVTKSSYTYEEIHKQLLRGALAKGYPAEGAVVQTQDGQSLSEGKTYGAGVYRLKFLTPTSQGFVEAYMYCQF